MSETHQRSISARGALCIVAGSMLGVGIFLSPVQMAALIQSPLAYFGVWIFAAVIVLGGSVAYAELATAFPHAGGDYVYHRQIFGPSVAFASGWALFAGIFSGSIAAVAVAMCQFQLHTLTGIDFNAPVFELFGFTLRRSALLGVGIVLLFTLLNVRGISLSEGVQKLCTLVPLGILTLLALVALGFFFSGSTNPKPAEAPVPVTLSALVGGYLLAYFAYSGWNAVTYVAGEVKDPTRNIPRALCGGAGIVAGLYLLLNIIFFLLLGPQGLAESNEAGSALALSLFGRGAELAMNGLILICLAATLNASILGGGRIAYAMAKDGAFLKRAATLNPKTGTPSFALWLQAAWSSILILSNSFDQLLAAVSLTMLCTGSLTVLSFFALRLKQPASKERWRAFGYPWLPALYLISSALVLTVKLYEAFVNFGRDDAPLLGLVIVLVAFAAHAIYRRMKVASR